MKMYIHAGESMVSWKDGKVVHIPPAELEKMLAEAEQAGLEPGTDQASDHVTDQVNALLEALATGEASGAEAMRRLSLSHRPTFRQNYLTPALEHRLIERTVPASPRSPRQKYRLTEKGAALRKSLSRKRRGTT